MPWRLPKRLFPLACVHRRQERTGSEHPVGRIGPETAGSGSRRHKCAQVRPLDLAAAEFELLRLISINAGRVLTSKSQKRRMWRKTVRKQESPCTACMMFGAGASQLTRTPDIRFISERYVISNLYVPKLTEIDSACDPEGASNSGVQGSLSGSCPASCNTLRATRKQSSACGTPQ